MDETQKQNIETIVVIQTTPSSAIVSFFSASPQIHVQFQIDKGWRHPIREILYWKLYHHQQYELHGSVVFDRRGFNNSTNNRYNRDEGMSRDAFFVELFLDAFLNGLWFSPLFTKNLNEFFRSEIQIFKNRCLHFSPEYNSFKNSLDNSCKLLLCFP